ncbi:hypothetical protein PENARI_c005G06275 [Penicillium arizonense]|uniref:AMP-dependent synthetase/ligase domain-containing protein n=1 Tax=Penicillium arizonense TaxID=1835702 RepID=A0A1F5LPA3_PENAI|nr:hypothetical protein PENARI_c005G06275 [Penicillium arizonense]OGE54926.1 hypothetical protein PENARI_c005G06275 [Penicillium arizonense]
MSPNSVEIPAVIWGCLYAGGTVTPANPDLRPAELHRQLVSSRTKVLVVHPQCLKVAKEAFHLGQLDNIRLLVLEGNLQEVKSVTEFIDAVEGENHGSGKSHIQQTWTPINPAVDIAYLVYSSGTTGYPKGVMISHRNVVAAVMLQSAVERLICLLHLPLWLGISTFFMEKFELRTFCRLVDEHNITQTYVAPPVVIHVAKSPIVEQYNMKSLQMITSGGAPLSTGLINELFHRRELPRWNELSTGIGSNGAPLPNLETKMMRSDGFAAVRKEEGELWIRGPTVFLGYMDDPGMTATCLTKDGWFKTGDIGYEDDQGNLYITDRAKDMIKFKGYQVAPAELEDVLLTHPAVDDAAVLGVINQDIQSEVPF